MINRNQGATRHPRRCNGINGNGKEEEEFLIVLSIIQKTIKSAGSTTGGNFGEFKTERAA
jgi:hypothetical protein